MFVGGGNQTPRRDQPHSGQALLVSVLFAVEIAVVEDLADHVGAVKGRIGDDPHGGRRFSGGRPAAGGVDHLRPVDVFPFGDAGTDHQQQLQDFFGVELEFDAVPQELTAIDGWFAGLAI